MRSEELALDAADRQDAPSQADLPGHREIAANRAVEQERGHRREDRDAGARAVLRGARLGDVHVQVDLLEPLGIEVQLLRLAAHEGDGRRGRLLHHVAHVSREHEVALTGHLRRLDEQQIAPGAVRRQPRRDAGRRAALGHLGAVLVWPEDALDVIAIGGLVHVLALGELHGGGAADRGDLSFHAANAGLARVVVEDDLDALGREVEPVFGEPVRPELLGDEEGRGDAELLCARVAGDLDHLHAVDERTGDGVAVVGGRQERHLRQVEGQVEVVILERRVLLRVEHLEQRRRGIASNVGAHLLDLVEDEDGVLRASLLQRLDDASGQGADIRAPVPTDLGLVADAAEGDALVAAPHGARDRLAERGLADAGRAHEEQDGALLVSAQLADGGVLDDALFYLLEAEVVLVEALAHLLDVDLVLRRLRPGQVGDPLEVGLGDVELSRLLRHRAQA